MRKLTALILAAMGFGLWFIIFYNPVTVWAGNVCPEPELAPASFDFGRCTLGAQVVSGLNLLWFFPGMFLPLFFAGECCRWARGEEDTWIDKIYEYLFVEFEEEFDG